MPSEEFSAFRLGGLGSCHVLGSNKFALRIFRVHFAVNSVLCMGFVLALSLSSHKAATICYDLLGDSSHLVRAFQRARALQVLRAS